MNNGCETRTDEKLASTSVLPTSPDKFDFEEDSEDFDQSQLELHEWTSRGYISRKQQASTTRLIESDNNLQSNVRNYSRVSYSSDYTKDKF